MTIQGEGDFLTRIRVGSKSYNYFEVRTKITKLVIELMENISLSGLRFWKSTKIEALLHTTEIESFEEKSLLISIQESFMHGCSLKSTFHFNFRASTFYWAYNA